MLQHQRLAHATLDALKMRSKVKDVKSCSYKNSNQGATQSFNKNALRSGRRSGHGMISVRPQRELLVSSAP